MAYSSFTQSFPADFSLNDWETQLAIYQAIYSTEDVQVYYLDDENDEIKINNQDDLDYAYQIAASSTNNVLKLILRNSRSEIISKPKLTIDQKALRAKKTKPSVSTSNMSTSPLSENFLKLEQDSINSSFTLMSAEFNKALPALIQPTINSCSSSSSSKLDAQTNTTENINQQSPQELKTELEKMISSHLSVFKQNLFSEIDSKIKSIVKSSNNFLIDSVDVQESELESQVEKLFDMICDAKASGRSIKCAFLEEELHSLGAFWAEFVKDCNMPDGTKCLPNTKFQKEWLIKNNGKLNWDEKQFPVKLICIGGTIVNSQPFVHVSTTRVNETTSISVDLVAPEYPGSYFSEWVLSCNGFQFGPRVWCSIQVVASDLNNTSASVVLNDESDKCQNDMPKSQADFDLNVNQASSSVQSDNEDDEEEFVVVPDCFDLNKKWKKESAEESSCGRLVVENTLLDQETKEESKLITTVENKELISPESNKDEMSEAPVELSYDDQLVLSHADLNETLNESQMVNVTKEDEEDSEFRDLVMWNSSDVLRVETNVLAKENVINSENGELETLVQSPKIVSETIPVQESLLTTLVDNSEKKEEEEEDIANSIEESDVRIKKIVVNNEVEEVDETTRPVNHGPDNVVVQESPSNLLSTFDKMKNAFSNLGRPSFVGSFDLVNGSSSVDESESRLLNEKLIMMGFANRKLNERLLKRFRNNIDQVVQHLVEKSDNNWSQNR